MRLTLYTDYALRVLIQVGLNEGKRSTIKDIARSFGISKPHLMKVVNDLSQKGYLETVRGRKGGIRLMREPQDINIGQVVRDTEDQLDVIGCLERRGYCPIQRICVAPRRSKRCNRGISCGPGYLHFSRFAEAAKSVVVATPWATAKTN